MVITRGKVGWEEVEEGKEGIMVMEGDLTWGGEHTLQYVHDVLQNRTPET